MICISKKIQAYIFSCCLLAGVQAQTGTTPDCTDNMRKNAKAGVDLALRNQRLLELGQRASLPYTMRIQVIVFHSGTPTVTDADIDRNIRNMANFYRPQNICFVLSGIDYVLDAGLANFHTNNESQLMEYTRPSYLTIFIHTQLYDSQGSLNGQAYAIPNTYLSIVDDAILSTTNISTLAHEMGHCFGLYHTFDSYYGSENRARSGSCKNCETTGDFLCDTEADRNLPDSLISINCIYTGTQQSSCDATVFVMEPRNIMTYGRRACRDRLSNGQGARSRDHILTETMLYSCIAPDVLTITNNTNYTGGVYSLTSKELINVTSSSYNISGNAQMRMTSRRIRIGPGASFKPAPGSAIVALKSNTYCE